MVVAGDVTVSGGRVVLKTGSVIAEKHLRIFRSWGVTDVDVEGITRDQILARAAAALPPASLDDIDSLLDDLFRFTDRSHPVIAELLHLTRMRLIREAAPNDARGR